MYGCLALACVGLLLGPVAASGAPDRFKLVWLPQGLTLEQELREQTVQGYRLRLWSGWLFFFERRSEKDERPEYVVVHSEGATRQRDLNEAASRGFRLMPLRGSAWGPLIMERASSTSGLPRFEYKVVKKPTTGGR
jgi:hypothetical protein